MKMTGVRLVFVLAVVLVITGCADIERGVDDLTDRPELRQTIAAYETRESLLEEETLATSTREAFRGSVPQFEDVEPLEETQEEEWVGVAFREANDEMQEYQLSLTANQVTLVWYNVSYLRNRNWVELPKCSLLVVTTQAVVRTNGAYRTFELRGGLLSQEKVEELVNQWVMVLEEEPGGACAFGGAYEVHWLTR